MNDMILPIGIASLSSPSRQLFAGNQPTALADIYRDEANITIWERNLRSEIVDSAAFIVSTMPKLQTSAIVSPNNVGDYLNDLFGAVNEVSALKDDIVQLVDMFCCLFDLKRAGLRLTVLDRAMCPRFHVDRIPCRLVTTYQGIATEWLPHNAVDRSKLGSGNQGKSDERSGLIQCVDDIRPLKMGDVALLKGELWQGNEGGGVVHRSPQVSQGHTRLLLTLDFAQ